MTNKVEIINPTKTDSHKNIRLVLGILFDLIGMLSLLGFGLGELTDVVWAPISGLLLATMYKGATGKIAGTIDFIEELIPGLDFIPTFTLTWIYVYILKK